MKRRYFLLLAIALSGCVLPTGPEPYLPSNFKRSINDNYLFFPALKAAYYTGILSTRWQREDYLDSAGTDTTYSWYQSEAFLYNDLGDVVRAFPGTLTLTLNGHPFTIGRYADPDTTHYLNFPAPVIWSLDGDSYFPSFTRTISSEGYPDILSPPASDTLSVSTPFDCSYVAPGTDTLTLTLLYLGSGYVHFDNDTGWTYVTNFPYLHNELVANSGHAEIFPSIFLPDSNFIRSYIPQKLVLGIAWAQGDTVQRNGKLFGFITEVVRSREYTLKP